MLILCSTKLGKRSKLSCFKATTTLIRRVWTFHPQIISWQRKWKKLWKFTFPSFQPLPAPQVLPSLPQHVPTTPWSWTAPSHQTMIEFLKVQNSASSPSPLHPTPSSSNNPATVYYYFVHPLQSSSIPFNLQQPPHV